MTTDKDSIREYYAMFSKLINEEVKPKKFIGFDISNSESVNLSGSFSFEQDLIHTLGVIDFSDKKFKITIRDPFEFSQSKTIESVEIVEHFKLTPKFEYNIESGEIITYAE